MAELGIINQTDVHRGVSTPSRAAETQAIGGALQTAANAIDGIAMASATEDFETAITDVLDQAVQETEHKGPPATLANDEAVALTAQIDSLRTLKAQGNSSQKTLADIRLKEKLAEAQRKFPWLRDELQRRAGAVQQASVELQQLGMIDAVRTSEAEMAAERLKDLQDHAVKDWDEGGLGISPEIPVGSPQWVQEYTTRQRLREADTRRQMLLTMRELDATESFDIAVESLQGRISGARSALEGIYSRNGLNAAMEAAAMGEAGNPDILRQFEAVGATATIRDLEALNTQILQVKENVWDPKLANTEDGKVIDEMVKDFVAENNKRIELVRAMINGVPGAGEQLEMLRAARSLDMYSKAPPAYRALTAFVNDGQNKTLLEIAAADLTGAGQVVQQEIASVASQALASEFPRVIGGQALAPEQVTMAFNTTGQGAVTDDMSPSEIIRTLRATQSESPNPYYVTASGPNKDQKGIAATIELHSSLWERLRATSEMSSLKHTSSVARGYSYALLGLIDTPNPAPDLVDMMVSRMGSSKTAELITRLGDEAKNTRRALGDALNEFYVENKPDAKRKELTDLYNNTRISGVPLSALAQIDKEALATDGTITYRVHNGNLDKAIKARQSELAISDTGPLGVQVTAEAKVEREILEEITTTMDNIVSHAQKEVDLVYNMNLAIQPTFKPMEANTKAGIWETTGWLEHFRYTD